MLSFLPHPAHAGLKRTSSIAVLAIVTLLATAAMLHAARAADPAPAASAPLYNVEIVVFRANSPLGVPENWLVERLQQAASGNQEHEAGESSAAAPALGERLSFQPLSAAQFKLAGTDAALRRSPGYEVLAHVAWTQSPAVFGTGSGINLAELPAAAGQALQGQVGLEQGRYLHLNLDLNWTSANPPSSLLGTAGRGKPVTFTLRQKRRVRPFEQHYFDHPAFGVIAIVTPVAQSGE